MKGERGGGEEKGCPEVAEKVEEDTRAQNTCMHKKKKKGKTKLAKWESIVGFEQ